MEVWKCSKPKDEALLREAVQSIFDRVSRYANCLPELRVIHSRIRSDVRDEFPIERIERHEVSGRHLVEELLS